MSKKIVICPDNGNKIRNIVAQYLSKHKYDYYSYCNWWDEEFYDYDYDWRDYYSKEAEIEQKRNSVDDLPFWEYNRKKKHNRGSRGKGNKNRMRVDETDFVWGDEDDMEWLYPSDNKIIYFYEDIENTLKGGDSEATFVFESVDALKAYCMERGIYVSHGEITAMMGREVTHCCISPMDKAEGNLVLLTDSSYGSLYWMCIDD